MKRSLSTRSLTAREREVLEAMILRGVPDPEDHVTPEDRARWLARVPGTRVGGRCSCGECPTVELVYAHGRAPSMEGSRVVLHGEVGGLQVLLFVDDDELSNLEGAPLDSDQVWTELPPVSELRFPGFA